MSEEHQRTARNPGEPVHDATGPGTARWAAYLDWLRADLRDGVLALDEAGRHTARLPSGWTPAELLSHGLHMEQRWFVWGFLGEPVAQPWGDWTVEEPWRDEAAGRWHVPDDVSVEQLAARLDAVGARTRSVLRDFRLDARASPGGRFSADPPDLEWICVHVATEYARHLGHLDVVVELGADGG